LLSMSQFILTILPFEMIGSALLFEIIISLDLQQQYLMRSCCQPSG